MGNLPPDLSVVVVTWNALTLTRQALQSIIETTRDITYEILAVDNGSTLDGSAVALPSEFPAVRWILNRANLGFTKANNQGIIAARGRYVLLLNCDTVQTENALGAAVAYMDAHPDVGALGIQHLNAGDRLPQASHFRFPRPWREAAALLTWLPIRASATTGLEQEVDWIVGSFLMMRRACLEQVGMLDERFFIYAEDIDWCRRARTAGWQVRFWPGVSMLHVGSSSQPYLKDKMFIQFRSHLSYLRKHHAAAAALVFYLAMNLRLAVSTLAECVRALTGSSDLAAVRARARRQLSFLFLRSGRSGA